MERDILIGIDVGTTGVKGIAFDSAKVKCLKQEYEMHEMSKCSSLEKEQDPQVWMQNVAKVMHRLCKWIDENRKGSRISTLCLSGQMQSVVAVDEEFDAKRPAILFNDCRAVKDAEHLESEFISAKEIEDITGNFKGASSCLAKLAWMKKNENSVLEESKHILLGAHSFIFGKLTGCGACDFTTAHTTSLLDYKAKEWAHELLKKVELESISKKLPQLIVPTSYVRQTTWEHFWKVSGMFNSSQAPSFECCGSSGETIDVLHGAGDLATTALGSQTISSNSNTHIYLGTSGWIATVQNSNQARDDIRDEEESGVFRILHPVKFNELEIVALPTMTSGGNVEWAKKCFAENISNREFDKMASEIPVGSGGILFLPHLAGERAPCNDPLVRGAFVGFGIESRKGHFFRAVLEGVAFHFLWLFENMKHEVMKQGGGDEGEQAIVFVGGGSKSKLWSQIMADVLNREIICKNDDCFDASVLGAIHLAEEVTGLDLKVQHVETFIPKEENVQKYKVLFSCWKDLFENTRKTNHILSEFR